MWDAARKCIVISCTLASQQNIWECNGSDWKKRVKIEFRKLQKTRRSGGKHKEFCLKTAMENYLNLAQTLYKKINTFKSVFKVNTIHQYSLLLELEYYSKMPAKHIDLAERRLLKGEKIPYSEKVFSLFEPHTKWINKGKARVIAEPGQKHLIITDQNHFIVYHRLTGDPPDAEFTVKTAKEVKKQFGNRLASLSFDKGFSSKEIIAQLEKSIPDVMLKQKGRRNKVRLETERDKDFKQLNNSHQSIESDINQPEHHGLNKCPDKGEENFEKYVALAVLSYNLYRLGNLIKKKSIKEKTKQRHKVA